ncbi:MULTISPECIES: SMP-30/gluconolactonase/LRE family protein [Streptomyces]|uniref:SMP-30/gluconolactonase/LRE family protein n=1 Tax=Streptomyces TaxID=1883 RepID=UPI000BC78536|nr:MULTISPECIES: SMP-30/gluconolactonase/LRE family protein [Streptomyces]MDX2551109.1 SMP-30/gluconolactonase/LRE family protein [Streptomyces stelliscabiei]MDX2614896.1 SMP-30/gluconolactonase/LRE family protein [Streptomyces stelliscabiei]MDX2635504.1 SMP-30/gluconolactonase/LRE family protein [Streptomyces stelliscabiei]MDX2667765.1 SMP-30/gluconolactonase/LRE family protein [Streptomyces stelliscabiei]MDX2718539.1 SMP-30/gluconolactonase/LRE family protein [Streptomyces stelliscabiei]
MTGVAGGTDSRGAGLRATAFVGIGGRGPEDVIVDERGRVLTGVEDGRVLRVDGLAEPGRARVETVAETGGRPLGLELLPDGDLLVCDAERGLLRVTAGDGTVRVLADEAGGERLRFCSNVVALSDGTVYFTVSSRRYPLHQWIGDIVEHTGTGRLLRLAPGESTPEVVLEGLQFANGLAPSADESFLVVAQTGARRLTRVHLTGARAGTSEPFVEDLPGTPDNMWRGPDGLMWVALAGPRIGALDRLHRAGPAVRRAASRVAVRAPYRPLGFAGVVAVDDQGHVVHTLVDHRSRYRMVTAACVADGRLILGSLWERGVAVCELPAKAA